MNFSFSYNASEIGTLIGIIAGVAVVGILFFLYLKNLNDLLKAVCEQNRRTKPSSVWLLYLSVCNSLLTIPVFLFAYNYPSLIIAVRILSYAVSIFIVIWYFKIVKGIAMSIEAEFDSRNIPIEYRPSYQTGMFMTVSLAITLVRACLKM